MYLIFKNSFLKSLNKLNDTEMKEKIATIIIELENYDSFSEIKNLKKLSGHKTFYRIRIGDFRIGLEYKSNQITLVEVLHRKDIYKKFP